MMLSEKMLILLTLIQDDCRSKDHYASIEELQKEQKWAFTNKYQSNVNTFDYVFEHVLCSLTLEF